MTSLWGRFRALPVWGQAIGWVLLWPALAAVWLLQREDAGTASRIGAALLAVVAVAWVTAPFASEEEPGDERPVAAESTGAAQENEHASAETPAVEEAAPSPSPSAATSPKPTPSPSPSPSSALTRSPSPTPSPVEPDGEEVVRVIDGDTLEAAGPGGAFTVRLAQVDAPETDQCFGDRATEALRRMAGPGTRIEVRRPGPPYEDPYGRTLGEVLLTDGTSVSVQLVRDGYATWGEEFADEDRNLAARMREAEQAARSRDAGLWDACRSEPAGESAGASGGDAEAQPAQSDADGGEVPFGGSSCHPGYDPCIPPKSEVGDLNCPDIRERYPDGVSVDHAHGDPHGLDGDSDGHGCE